MHRMGSAPRALMGPRPGGRGERLGFVTPAKTYHASMGPRPGGRGEADASRKLLFPENASMGPRPGGRGEPAPTGATAPRRRLQWGRAPEGAERRSVSLATRAEAELQWGRAPEGAESPRESPPRTCRDASMGPRPGGRGEVAKRCEDAPRRPAGFNGAAPRRARRGLDVSQSWPGTVELQWGRAPEGAESPPPVAPVTTNVELQWGRAPEGAERPAAATNSSTARRFNGAAPRRARRGRFTVSRVTPRSASMGPRPGGRGEECGGRIAGAATWLQWGRAPEGAERRKVELTINAAIELQWGRAPEGAERTYAWTAATYIVLLQWGRAPEGAERASETLLAVPATKLQWGRAPEGAERREYNRNMCAFPSFNGAAPRRARREPERFASCVHSMSLQWGRAPEGAESMSAVPPLYPFAMLQWGRAPEGAESAIDEPLRNSAWRLQWGRAPEGAERSKT